MTSAEPDDTIRLRVPRRAGRLTRLLPWFGGATLGAVFAAGGVWWSLRPPPPVVTVSLSAPAAAPLAPAAPRVATEPAPQSASAPAPAPAPQQTAGAAQPGNRPVYEPLNTARPAPSAGVADATERSIPRPVVEAALAPPDPAAPPPYAPPLATEAQILADKPDHLAVYRFAAQPAVVVLQFPTLAEQGRMLNRLAALVEKAGFPHEQVMPMDALNAQIVASGATPDNFYYGHDYRSSDLVRFFTLAKDLDPEEQELQDLMHKLRWDEKGAVGALVTVVRQSPAAGLDASARAAILRHELSHGVYFTNPDYAAYCATFWHDRLTPDERAKFIAFLGREGYDTALPDLMINETQAYLMHTPDRRFFSAAEVGIAPQRIAELRQLFLLGMPPGWLHDNTSTDNLP